MSKDSRGASWVHTGFILVVAVAYLLAYLADPALPGNSVEHPLGWWGWFDQGEYIKAARAFSSLNLTSENYFYPPLYPLLGAVFIRINPVHPFAIVDMVCVVLYAHFFVSFARRYVGWFGAVMSFIFPLLWSGHIVKVWAEPWTTTLTAALSAILVFEVAAWGARAVDVRRALAWGLLWGGVFATRPVDAAVIAPLLIFGAYGIWHRAQVSEEKTSIARRYAAIALGAGTGLAFFVLFNIVVHGNPIGRYFAAGSSNGFFLADVAEKSVSLFLDAGALYNEPESSFFAKLKWSALFVPAAVYVALRGPVFFKVLLATVVTHLILYAAYADLLPTGMWRFNNVHYFKWLLPYVALIIFWYLREVSNWRSRGGSPILVSLCLGALLLCLRFDMQDVAMKSVLAEAVGPGRSRVMNFGRVTRIDKIEIQNLEGDFSSVYFGKGSAVRVDGRSLRFVHDYRFLPSTHGVDLLFIRPVDAKVIEFDLGDMVADQGPLLVRPYTYSFTVGLPAWLLDGKVGYPSIGERLSPRYEASLAEGIQFTRPGYPMFLREVVGISGAEAWGRWSETDSSGAIEFVFTRTLPRRFDLVLDMGAFGQNVGSTVVVEVGDEKNSLKIASAEAKTYVLTFDTKKPADSIRMTVPHPTRPKDVLSGSTDSRLLGLSFVSLRVMGKE